MTKNRPIKIIVCGASGRMGSEIVSLAQNDSALELGGAVDLVSAAGCRARFSSRLADFISETDVVIDFTTPSASCQNLEIVRQNKKALILGTTGFSPTDVERITDAAKIIPIVFSPNMSIGVNLLFSLIRNIARILPDYEVEILEFHHNQKKDAPSGTASKLARIVAEEKGQNTSIVYGRQGITGPRPTQEIGVMALRAGDVVGEHTVYFVGEGERLEITHRAQSRKCFAAGALAAAKWIFAKPAELYSMGDVLGLTDKPSDLK
ncbi:MAG: 4-hydroxy-tetrahydrodipicolinate reductase [Candidatus Zixiibacteriota bacterium]